jgi:hypothetical protein
MNGKGSEAAPDFVDDIADRRLKDGLTILEVRERALGERTRRSVRQEMLSQSAQTSQSQEWKRSSS